MYRQRRDIRLKFNDVKSDKDHLRNPIDQLISVSGKERTEMKKEIFFSIKILERRTENSNKWHGRLRLTA